MFKILRRYQFVLMLLTCWAFAVASRFWANGISFGLDYGIYQPDGAHYAYRALVFMGKDSIDAASQVASWYQIHGFKNNIFDPSFLYPTNYSSWGLVAPRIIYPLLSVPFVFLLGIPGMLVIPSLSLLIVFLVILAISKKHSNPWIGIGLVFLISVSPTILRWMLSNITDSLVTALFSLIALHLSQNVDKRFSRIILMALIFLTSFTRFSLPIWMAIAIVLFINRNKLKAFLVLFASVIFSIPTFLYMPHNAILPGSQPEDFSDRVVGILFSFFNIVFWEFSQLAVLDRVLLALILLSLMISVLTIREISSQYFLAVFFAVLLIGAINGTIGVNFRYQLPVLGFMSWVIISNLRLARDWIFRS